MRKLNFQNSGAGGFTALSSLHVLQNLLPVINAHDHGSLLRRKSLEPIHDNGSFIKPIKQCFVRNARLMPGTRIMLALLSGWAGQGGTIQTTTCSIGRQISRSRRQVFRYLKDAMEEGYLVYSKTKDRIGYITGIRIWLNFGAITHSYERYLHRKKSEHRRKQDVTLMADINSKFYFKGEKDEVLDDALSRFAQNIGLKFEPGIDYG